MSVTVKEFFDSAKKDFPLRVVCGAKFMERKIRENAINRPGLALSGFFQYFAEKRIQVIGLSETFYLKSLPEKERFRRVEDFFAQRIPCVVFTRKRHIMPEFKTCSERYRTPILSTSLITSQFINLATLEMEDLTAPRQCLHGTMLDVSGIGILLQGDAGIGKSETALALIERGNSLVADDLTVLIRAGHRTLIASSSEITRYHMEIRGLGIIHVPSLFGVSAVRREKSLDLIVYLYRQGIKDEDVSDRTGLEEKTKKIMGLKIPFISLPVTAGRDIANVIEVAAINHRLKLLGHNAAKELDEKIIKNMKEKFTLL